MSRMCKEDRAVLRPVCLDSNGQQWTDCWSILRRLASPLPATCTPSHQGDHLSVPPSQHLCFHVTVCHSLPKCTSPPLSSLSFHPTQCKRFSPIEFPNKTTSHCQKQPPRKSCWTHFSVTLGVCDVEPADGHGDLRKGHVGGAKTSFEFRVFFKVPKMTKSRSPRTSTALLTALSEPVAE